MISVLDTFLILYKVTFIVKFQNPAEVAINWPRQGVVSGIFEQYHTSFLANLWPPQQDFGTLP